MDETQRRVDEVRREATELENHLIDEYVSGRITRRELVRRGTVVGMSLPVPLLIAAACGGDDDDGGAQTGGAETTAGAVQPGGTAPRRPDSADHRAEPAPRPGRGRRGHAPD